MTDRWTVENGEPCLNGVVVWTERRAALVALIEDHERLATINESVASIGGRYMDALDAERAKVAELQDRLRLTLQRRGAEREVERAKVATLEERLNACARQSEHRRLRLGAAESQVAEAVALIERLIWHADHPTTNDPRADAHAWLADANRQDDQ